MIEITVDYLTRQGLSANFPERFWKKVNKHGPIQAHCTELGPCWDWAPAKKSRYGTICRTKLAHSEIKAHRASWILHYGPIPEGLEVCHKCDNGRCVNPSHLWVGTHTDNMRDMIAKNRRSSARGERSGMSKFTERQIREMRKLFVPRSKTNGLKALMDRFSISKAHLCKVINLQSWAHVTP